jgi:hypothetical protein
MEGGWGPLAKRDHEVTTTIFFRYKETISYEESSKIM